MLLKQIFKTSEGASKRAAFENAHTTKYRFSVVRLRDGEIDHAPLASGPWEAGAYTWKLERRTVRPS